MSENPRPVPRILGERVLHGGFVRLSELTFEIEWKDKPHRIEREVHDHGDVASILPVDPARRMGILLRQFRLTPALDGDDGWLWEVPAGLLENAAPDKCARSEAHEEAGVEIGELYDLGMIRSSPGIMREKVHLYWGTYSGAPPETTGGLDHEDEMIEVHELPLTRIAELNDKGAIVDAKSALLIHRLRVARPDLFHGG